MIKYHVTLTATEREVLELMVSKGSHKSQKILNALILLNTDETQPKEKRSTSETVSKVLQISMKKIDRVKKRFVEESLEIALSGHYRKWEPEKKVDGDLKAKLVALRCSEAPEGFSRWSLRLLAEKAVELEYVDSISHEIVRSVLKKRIDVVEEKGVGDPSSSKR